jgi:hypothetical protein
MRRDGDRGWVRGQGQGHFACHRTHLVLGVRAKGPCIAAVAAEHLHPMPLGEHVGGVESCGSADTTSAQGQGYVETEKQHEQF